MAVHTHSYTQPTLEHLPLTHTVCVHSSHLIHPYSQIHTLHSHTAMHNPRAAHTLFTSHTPHAHAVPPCILPHNSHAFMFTHCPLPGSALQRVLVRSLIIGSDRSPLRQGKGTDINTSHSLSTAFGPLHVGSCLPPPPGAVLWQRSYPRVCRCATALGRFSDVPPSSLRTREAAGFSMLECVLSLI